MQGIFPVIVSAVSKNVRFSLFFNRLTAVSDMFSVFLQFLCAKVAKTGHKLSSSVTHLKSGSFRCLQRQVNEYVKLQVAFWHKNNKERPAIKLDIPCYFKAIFKM